MCLCLTLHGHVCSQDLCCTRSVVLSLLLISPCLCVGVCCVVTGMGATLMDGLDTLHIAGLTEEVAEAEAWLVSNFDVNNGRVGARTRAHSDVPGARSDQESSLCHHCMPS